LGKKVLIAILEDDPDIGAVMKKWLESEGHNVRHFLSGNKLVAAASHDAFDLYVVDWMVPDLTGLEVLQWLRTERADSTPVLFVTVRSGEQDVIRALNAGADDFLVKPIRRGELAARVNALMRRAGRQEQPDDSFIFPPFRIVPNARRFLCGEQTIDLTEMEFELALFLFRNAGKLLSRDNIASSVWRRSVSETSRTIDTHVSRVRRKLGLTPENGCRLVPVYSAGYRFERLLEGSAQD
jgi:DNA-binding response OmpR family regulator